MWNWLARREREVRSLLWEIREVFILRESVTFPFLNSKVRRRKWKE